jgi:molecular chaperone HtpG
MSTEIQILTTLAEKEAEKAESLPAFSGVKLLHIKRQVAELLNLIGRDGIFDEYTRHDISHVNEMLNSLDWIIPDSTKKKMSSADWLMIVLGIYFHDLGMLVTKTEYAARNESGFPTFKAEVLFAGPEGPDYQAKVNSLGPEAAERFFYQEFVRHKHAERIRAWIVGQPKILLGVTPEAMAEVTKLLEPLGSLFKRDLGVVCESHHLNDLDDEKKYKSRQPYRNSDAETVNLQYCAVLLRSADLLHITSDRTPSIAFRTINPTDPLSQQEWAKQMAVTRVRPKLGINDEGLSDEKAPKDTIEVHAYFTQEDGFFGLTSYLIYTSGQLKKSCEWITTTAKQKGMPHEFPWRKIDDSNIETLGFIRETFEFTIDQAKVLDLLTGHTLYNDTKVVLRELVQNSLDAIRLQFHPNRPTHTGKIQITWDTKNRVLAVQDNGTGMSQRIINNYLLKVGSSRYQDPEFKKEHPDFTSISRFGIGVLSAFMIADVVDILTCHPDDAQARQITLRSVHGKYLVRLLEKGSDPVKALGTHGSLFKLRVRQTIELADVVELAKHWLVVPDCEVSVTVDDGVPVKVGAVSIRAALIALLQEHNMPVDDTPTTDAPVGHSDDILLRVIDKKVDGVDVAFAVEWNAFFKRWSSMQSEFNEDSESNLSKAYAKLATCIEGIRVESGCPGIGKSGIFALANVTGSNAPKTNVARSGLEVTEQRDFMLERLYKVYGGHVIAELDALHRHRGFSLTWAAQEANYLFETLSTNINNLTSKDIFDKMHHNLALHLIEINNRRELRSAATLSLLPSVWMIDCSLLRSAEFLIREVKSDSSISQLANALGIGSFGSSGDAVLCLTGWRNKPDEGVLRDHEVERIRIHPEQRRVDLEWVPRKSSHRWRECHHRTILNWAVNGSRGRGYSSRVFIAASKMVIESPIEFGAIKAFGDLFVLPGSPITETMLTACNKLSLLDRFQDDWSSTITIVVLAKALSRRNVIKDGQDFVAECIGDLQSILFGSGLTSRPGTRLNDKVDFEQLSELVRNKRPMFDSSAWLRSGANEDF